MTMSELERLGCEVNDELGEPSPEWLEKQRRDLTIAVGLRSPQREMGDGGGQQRRFLPF